MTNIWLDLSLCTYIWLLSIYVTMMWYSYDISIVYDILCLYISMYVYVYVIYDTMSISCDRYLRLGLNVTDVITNDRIWRIF